MHAESPHRSFRDVIEALTANNELPPLTRRHWTCSLNRIARALGRRPEDLPARWIDVRQPVLSLHPATVGWTVKTISNHRTNVRRALGWFQRVAPMPLRGMSLVPVWACLWAGVSGAEARKRLSAFVRFLSLEAAAPAEVDEPMLDRFMQHRAEVTRLRYGVAERRRIAREWNSCVAQVPGWPQQRLALAPDQRFLGASWDSFPAALRADVEAYFDKLGQHRRLRDGRRARKCADSTIHTRRRELVAFACKAVAVGAKIETLTSLSALLEPSLVRRVLETYWRENGPKPETYTADLPWRLYVVARETGCLNQAELEELADMRADMDHERRRGVTPKNRRLIRQIKSTDVWTKVVALPEQLMAEARRERAETPLNAAVKAELAAAIAMLTFAPVRIGNLVSTRLEDNLTRFGGPDGQFYLYYPEYEVKNRVDLEFGLDPELTKIVSEYIELYRPALLRGFNERWLFPGLNGRHKAKHLLSMQMRDLILKRTGLRITAHQFRHVAAVMLLKRFPANYPFVAKLLGHKNSATTLKAYVDLEGLEVSEIFAKIVRGNLRFDPEL